jgi:hypothetical protein
LKQIADGEACHGCKSSFDGATPFEAENGYLYCHDDCFKEYRKRIEQVSFPPFTPHVSNVPTTLGAALDSEGISVLELLLIIVG